MLSSIYLLLSQTKSLSITWLAAGCWVTERLGTELSIPIDKWFIYLIRFIHFTDLTIISAVAAEIDGSTYFPDPVLNTSIAVWRQSSSRYWESFKTLQTWLNCDPTEWKLFTCTCIGRQRSSQHQKFSKYLLKSISHYIFLGFFAGIWRCSLRKRSFWNFFTDLPFSLQSLLQSH